MVKGAGGKMRSFVAGCSGSGFLKRGRGWEVV